MTQEEKQLLLKDLCARLPYGVKGLHRKQVHSITIIDASGLYPSIKVNGYDTWFPIETFKSYLRPMSNMTEEELKEYERANDIDTSDSVDTLKENMKAKARVRISKWYHGVDWLNKHHFDYRGLIEKRLALEAPEGMYKSE